MGWAVAQTGGGCESKAIRNLVRQGFEAFCPMSRRPYLRWGPDKLATLPLFPCYVFVLIRPDQQWHCINGTIGVVRLLTGRSHGDPRPVFVPDGKIDQIRALERTVVDPLPPGTEVRVCGRNNPFYEQVGTVVSMDSATRVSVLMSIFNRDVTVEFLLPDLEVAA